MKKKTLNFLIRYFRNYYYYYYYFFCYILRKFYFDFLFYGLVLEKQKNLKCSRHLKVKNFDANYLKVYFVQYGMEVFTVKLEIKAVNTKNLDFCGNNSHFLTELHKPRICSNLVKKFSTENFIIFALLHSVYLCKGSFIH